MATQGYVAYGFFGDDKFKYGISGKWAWWIRNPVYISGGKRRDIENWNKF